MNTPLAVVDQLSCAGPALVGTVLAEQGFRYTGYPLYRASDLPVAAGLVGLGLRGGPRSVRDDVTRPQLPRERNFIKKIVGAGLSTLGIRLGAQLLTGVVRRRDPVFGAVGATACGPCGGGRTEHDRFVPRPRRELTESGARAPMSFAHHRGLYR